MERITSRVSKRTLVESVAAAAITALAVVALASFMSSSNASVDPTTALAVDLGTTLDDVEAATRATIACARAGGVTIVEEPGFGLPTQFHAVMGGALDEAERARLVAVVTDCDHTYRSPVSAAYDRGSPASVVEPLLGRLNSCMTRTGDMPPMAPLTTMDEVLAFLTYPESGRPPEWVKQRVRYVACKDEMLRATGVRFP